MERYTKNKVLGQLIRNLAVVIGLLTAGQGTLVAGELIFDADFGNQADWQNTERGQSVEYPSNSARARAENNLPGNFDSYFTTEKWYPKGPYGAASATSPHPVGQISGLQSRRPGVNLFWFMTSLTVAMARGELRPN